MHSVLEKRGLRKSKELKLLLLRLDWHTDETNFDEWQRYRSASSPQLPVRYFHC